MSISFNVANILYPVKVLGPGERIGIWFSGCTHGCKGCCNPELWNALKRHNIKEDLFFKLIDSITNSYKVTGFTLTGGEPFMQPEALRVILPYLKKNSSDILVYTGYTIEQLKELGYEDILKHIAVLIDGKYIEQRNTNVFLRGSDNQKIHILNDDYKAFYEDYIANGVNEFQNFKTKTGFISVGIYKPHYKEDLKKSLANKGVKIS